MFMFEGLYPRNLQESFTQIVGLFHCTQVSNLIEQNEVHVFNSLGEPSSQLCHAILVYNFSSKLKSDDA